MMKKLFCIAVLLAVLCSAALADRDIPVAPTADDLQEAELREIAADFFCEKCGLDKEALLTAKMEFSLQRNELSESRTGTNSTPYWVIHIASYPALRAQGISHPGWHELRLTRDGALISWSAHGMEYTEKYPDIVRMGTQAAPLPTDAQEAEIIAQAKSDLQAKCGVEAPDAYHYQAAFLYEEHFNDGRIPVWIVYADQDGELVWKGAYSYNGSFMSLVPAAQDYDCYTTPDEEFFTAVYGEGWWDEAYKYAQIQDGLATKAEISEWIAAWRPLLDAWNEQHSYSAQGKEMDQLFRQYEKAGE